MNSLKDAIDNLDNKLRVYYEFEKWLEGREGQLKEQTKGLSDASMPLFQGADIETRITLNKWRELKEKYGVQEELE